MSTENFIVLAGCIGTIVGFITGWFARRDWERVR